MSGTVTMSSSALVKDHNYKKALKLYEAQLNQVKGKSLLRYDYALLQYKLKQPDFALEILGDEISSDPIKNLEEANYRILCLNLQTDIFSQQLDYEKALLHLKAATTQAKTITQVFGDVDIAGMKCSSILAELSIKSAEIYIKTSKPEHAIKSYNEVISYDPKNTKALISLARLHLNKDDILSAQNYCGKVLKTDPVNEEATITSAKILFKQKNYIGGVELLTKFLDVYPANWEAFWIYIEMCWRMGKLSAGNHDIDKVFCKAEELFGGELSEIESTSIDTIAASDQSSFKSGVYNNRDVGKAQLLRGYQFCRALYAKKKSQFNEALKFFHLCLTDQHYGDFALSHMIDIYLESGNIKEAHDLNIHNLEMASKLLDEYKRSRGVTLIYQCLYLLLLVSCKSKTEIEKYIPVVHKLLESNPNHPHIILSLSLASLSLKQPLKAKTLFQSISKEWPFEYADEYEKILLNLADIHIQTNKHDQAIDCFRQCIGYNQASIKSFEGMGFISEKEGSFLSAANYYEQAWRYGREDFVLGFKLAYCFLKAKKYVEAIETCHVILKVYPNYPRLKKEVLDKARQCIRLPQS